VGDTYQQETITRFLFWPFHSSTSRQNVTSGRNPLPSLPFPLRVTVPFEHDMSYSGSMPAGNLTFQGLREL